MILLKGIKIQENVVLMGGVLLHVVFPKNAVIVLRVHCVRKCIQVKRKFGGVLPSIFRLFACCLDWLLI